MARRQLDSEPDTPPAPGQGPLIMTGLVIGVLLMGIQLWLLTVALELFLGGEGESVWQLALASGVIFLGGLTMLWALRRRPRVRRTSVDNSDNHAEYGHRE
ncbi:MAG: hypothetical protein M3281_09650 [Chloroflexota bacterium]|nr:hypothetical protein [Chloroflexota bacterium]